MVTVYSIFVFIAMHETSHSRSRFRSQPEYSIPKYMPELSDIQHLRFLSRANSIPHPASVSFRCIRGCPAACRIEKRKTRRPGMTPERRVFGYVWRWGESAPTSGKALISLNLHKTNVARRMDLANRRFAAASHRYR